MECKNIALAEFHFLEDLSMNDVSFSRGIKMEFQISRFFIALSSIRVINI